MEFAHFCFKGNGEVDKEIVMTAIKNTPTAFRYASYLLAKDSDIVALLRKKGKIDEF